MKHLITPAFLLVAVFNTSSVYAHGWQAAAMWDWALNTANPQFAVLEADVATLQSEVASLQADLTTATAYIDDLQGYLSVDDTTDPGRPVVIVSGANLQVNNGMGSTPTINGVGNLIVGYDENMSFLCTVAENGPEIYDDVACGNQGGFPLAASAVKTGSHNLVVGDRHTYTSFAGIVGGTANFINGKAASITGGHYSTANGHWSHISGGELNIVYASRGSVSGGAVNTINTGARSASISGGSSNNINSPGRNASISGGSAATISGQDDWQAGTLFEDD